MPTPAPNRPNRSLLGRSWPRMEQWRLVGLAFLATLVLTGCSPKPHQSSPFGVCGGYFSEHDTKHTSDFWVTNEGDDLMFHLTNTSSNKVDKKPLWAMPGEDTLYYVHVQYLNVTVGCLEPLGYNKKNERSPDDEEWLLPPGQTVTARFSQQRVFKAMRAEVNYAVIQPGGVIRFNFDGFASNPCRLTKKEGQSHLTLVCEASTPEQRLEENRQRRSWWDRIRGKNDKEVWEG